MDLKNLKPGDRVRITFEGVLASRDDDDETFFRTDSNEIVGIYPDDAQSVELVQAPFRVGDLVQSLAINNYRFLILEGGWYDIFNRKRHEIEDFDIATLFPQGSYELVVSSGE